MESDQKDPKQSIRNAIVSTGDFLDITIPGKEIYLNPWLRSESIALITADRGTGKTWFAMAAGIAVSKGEAFGPWDAGKSVPVLYLEGEMAAVDVQERLLFLGGDNEGVSPFYIYSEAYSNQLGVRRAHLLDPDWQSEMKATLIDLGIKLFIIDNISSLSPGLDENSKQAWDPINQWLLELRFAGISMVLNHHTNKEGGQRGTHGRTDNIDISMVLKRPKNYDTEDGAKFIVSFDKNRVPHADLPKLADTEFNLTQDDQYNMVWTFGNAKAKSKIEIIRLADEGYKNKGIETALGCTRQYVSSVINRATIEGYLTTKRKLTQSGFEYVAK